MERDGKVVFKDRDMVSPRQKLHVVWIANVLAVEYAGRESSAHPPAEDLGDAYGKAAELIG